jgi:hypothetical protein
MAHGRDPKLAMLPDGNVIALWKQDGDGPFDERQLWSSRYDMASNNWTAPQGVDSPDAGNPLYGLQDNAAVEGIRFNRFE